MVGDYSEVLGYLERVNALSYYIVVDSLDVGTAASRNKSKFGPMNIQAELRGSIRWFAKSHPILARVNMNE